MATMKTEMLIFLFVTIILSVKVDSSTAQKGPFDMWSFRPTFRSLRDSVLNLIGQSGNDEATFDENLKQGVRDTITVVR